MENHKPINYEELEKLLQPHHPIGADFARRAEEQIFRFMFEWKVWKIYIWDDFHSDGSNARWDWCFGPIPPAGKACREHNFANLIAMDDWHFDRLVRSLPKSPWTGTTLNLGMNRITSQLKSSHLQMPTSKLLKLQN